MDMLSEFLATDGLSVEALHALVRLAEFETMTAAAGSSSQQPAYSKHFRKLSRFFGTSLTVKVGRVSRLSPAGEELAVLARQHLTALHDFKRRASAGISSYQMSASDSLIQGLLIPALAMMPRGKKRSRFAVRNRRTNQVISDLIESRADFGLVRANAVIEALELETVGTVRHIIVAPRRLMPQRGGLRIKDALLEVPHACVTGDGELVQKIQELARQFNGTFRPELECESHGQCLAAVRCGTFAAVIPTQVWEPIGTDDFHVIEEAELASLDRTIALAWLPRKLEMLGAKGEHTRADLLEALRNVSEQRGMVIDE